MSDTLVDVAGQEIRPGDAVVYPQMSGRSVQMVLGTLLDYNGKAARIERGEGTRWSASYAPTKYRNKRTGKNVDIYAGNGKHWETPSYVTYKHRETGEEISEEEMNRRHPIASAWHSTWQDRESRVARGKYDAKYHPGTLKDYVEQYQATPTPVTILNTRNIVKVISHSERAYQ